MAVTTLNVTAGSQAIVTLGNTTVMAAPGGTDGLALPTVQDVTVSAGTQSVRYSTLDSSASSAFTTVNENEITMNLLVDEDAFFGNSSLTNNPVTQLGLLTTSINKTEIEFSVAFSGAAAGNFYISGKGFIAGLSPTASVDQAIWQTPCQIIVNGELTKGTTS